MLAWLALVFSGFCAVATESDNFTARDLILQKQDAVPVLNSMVQDLIQSAVNQYNSQSPPNPEAWSELAFLQMLRKRLATNNFGPLAFIVEKKSFFRTFGVPITPFEWILDQHNVPEIDRATGFLDILAPGPTEIQKLSWGDGFDAFIQTRMELESFGHRTPFGDSIYGGLKATESGLSSMPRVLFASSLRLDSAVVGIDKIGHFFAQGYSYYLAHLEGNSVEKVMLEGKKDEESVMGLGTFGSPTFGSGVVSYGDLAANLSGMIFWHRLFHGKSALLKKVGNQIKVIRRFSFRDYPFEAWDEAINPSVFHPTVEKKVAPRIERLGYSPGVSVHKATAEKVQKLPCAQLFTRSEVATCSLSLEILETQLKP